MTTEQTFKELEETFGDGYTCTKIVRDDGTVAIQCTRNERNTDKQPENLTEA